jgi:hypothetical protein
LSCPCLVHVIFHTFQSYCMLLSAPHSPLPSSLASLTSPAHSPPFSNQLHWPFVSLTNWTSCLTLVVDRSASFSVLSSRVIHRCVRLIKSFNLSPPLSDFVPRFWSYGDFSVFWMLGRYLRIYQRSSLRTLAQMSTLLGLPNDPTITPIHLSDVEI